MHQFDKKKHKEPPQPREPSKKQNFENNLRKRATPMVETINDALRHDPHNIQLQNDKEFWTKYTPNQVFLPGLSGGKKLSKQGKIYFNKSRAIKKRKISAKLRKSLRYNYI